MSCWPVFYFYWNWRIVERLFPNTCSFLVRRTVQTHARASSR
jgi:hypothetical protein